jgi:hypothetical protein
MNLVLTVFLVMRRQRKIPRSRNSRRAEDLRRRGIGLNGYLVFLTAQKLLRKQCHSRDIPVKWSQKNW